MFILLDFSNVENSLLHHGNLEWLLELILFYRSSWSIPLLLGFSILNPQSERPPESWTRFLRPASSLRNWDVFRESIGASEWASTNMWVGHDEKWGKRLKGKRRGLEMSQNWLGNHNILIALLQASSMWASL
jgi:hypothetical protein